MTATPRIYSEKAQLKAKEEDIYVASMDNEEQYGPEFHRLGFAEALDTLDEKGEPLLSDYKVIILVMGEKQIARDYQGLLAKGEALADVGRVIGCLNGLAKIDPEGREFTDDPEPMHRAVAFSNTIAASKRFVDLVQREQDEAALTARNLSIEGRHVDGKTGVTERDRQLSWLREEMTMVQSCHVLSNARCLTEGIDVPALDAILFFTAAQIPDRRGTGSRSGYAQSTGQTPRLCNPACSRAIRRGPPSSLGTQRCLQPRLAGPTGPPSPRRTF